jgi:hypothetical protein
VAVPDSAGSREEGPLLAVRRMKGAAWEIVDRRGASHQCCGDGILLTAARWTSTTPTPSPGG